MKNINKIFSKLLGMLCHLTSKDFLTFIFYASFIFLLKRFFELQYLFLSRERDLHLSFFKINIIKNHLHFRVTAVLLMKTTEDTDD